MALILGYHPLERIYFGDIPVTVLNSVGHSEATLEVEGHEFKITDTKMTEILKGVYVSCGVPKAAREGEPALPRLVIEAPRSLLILREDLYKNGKPRQRKEGVPDTA